jgi:ribosomal protein S18 acetylase RimI-like enzyme
MTCRLYNPGDFEALYAVEEACFPPLFRFGRRYMRQLIAQPNTAAWIAEEKGRMAGFAIVEWTLGEQNITAYVQTIEVVAEARRHGVGRALLRCLEGSARQAGAGLLWLHVDQQNHDAIRMYAAQNYCEKGREEDYYPFGRAALIYAKRLEAGGQE